MSPTQYNTGPRKQPLRGIEATIWAVGIVLLLVFLGWAFFGGDQPTPERPGPRTPIAGGPSAPSGTGAGEPTTGTGDEDLAARTMKLLARSGEGTDPASPPLTPVPAPPPAPLDPPAPAVATAPPSTPLVEPGSEPTPLEPPLTPPPAALEPPVSPLPGAAGLSAVAGSEPPEPAPAPGSSTVTPLAPAPTPAATPRLTATTPGTERPGADLVSTYQIEEGDTLSDLALRFYGSAQQWRQIAKANPDLNPDRLKVGQTIRLPDPEAIAASEAPPAATPPAGTGEGETAAAEPDETPLPDGSRRVRVKAGDSLS
ncbi:MAG: LysM peptidoglycan-binding domain-containing protein, partial [Phycisphaerae bacterium]|nr:LysM peptidoglycan-binding domain-containing protein [Phycisphaerae bacterium]